MDKGKRLLPSSPARSRIMAGIRSRGNKSTEMKMARLLRRAGLSGWRRHLDLPGRPDFAFPSSRLAVFVDGCFWHGCPRCFVPPRNNADFWEAKISGNRRRDRLSARKLRAMGWSVIRIWGHSLDRHPSLSVRRVEVALSSPRPRGAPPPPRRRARP